MKNNICLNCGHSWVPRTERTKKCPQCNSYKWNGHFPKRCRLCGRIFIKVHQHHKDGNHNNNLKENVIIICEDCHAAIHTNSLENNTRNTNNSRKIRNYKKTPYSIILKINALRRMLKGRKSYDGKTNNTS